MDFMPFNCQEDRVWYSLPKLWFGNDDVWLCDWIPTTLIKKSNRLSPNLGVWVPSVF